MQDRGTQLTAALTIIRLDDAQARDIHVLSKVPFVKSRSVLLEEFFDFFQR
jgi:hypothetical protein